jgi:polar amino acid transport system permease protein
MFDFSVLVDAWRMFLDGLLMTIFLTIVGCSIGTIIGASCAWGSVYGSRWLKLLINIYVEVFRNTPFIVQLFFIFFGLASINLRMGAVAASIFALAINLGAYACEICRAGILATPKGQYEAASSLSLNRFQIFMYVVIPPALARVWPALVSQLIIMLLATSVCSQVSTEELFYVANLISSQTFRSFESLGFVTLLYLLLAMAFRQILFWFGPAFIFGKVKF